MLLLLASTKSNLEKELRNFYQKYGKDGVVTYQEARKWVSEKDHRKRLTVLLLFINDEFTKLHGKLSPEFESMLKDIINEESIFFDSEVDDSKILTQPWGADKKTWSDRLSDDITLWSVYIATDLKRNLLKKSNVDAVISQLNKRFSNIDSVLEKLGITESTAIGSMARRQLFGNLGISKYQFYTRDDERRCEVCGAMHGITFPMSAYEVGVTASPLHPRCRCWEVPIWE